MLRSIEFIKDYRSFTTGSVIQFKEGVNLLCGDQGVGKSSLLDLIKHKNIRDGVIDLDFDRGSLFSFDFEKDNPRVRSSVGGSLSDMIVGANSKFKSHGETTLTILRNSIPQLKSKYVMLDEPDQGLSIRSCIELVSIMNMFADNGCQVLATIHNPIIIEAYDVFNLHNFEWQSGNDFIDFMREC
jgi:predicted ATPase